MPQHFGDDDRHDDLAALDFYGTDETGSHSDGVAESDALDFSAAADDSGVESEVDALDEYAPTEPEENGSELDAIDSVTEDTEEEEEDGMQLFTVTNPPETVSVSALIDGRTQRVRLSPKATNLTESELAEEVIVLADLARQKGRAGQHTYLMENASQTEGLQELGEIGLDSNELLRQFTETGMQLPTPEQADAAQAEVFAARYTADK
jgi:hypothetical protein